MTERVSACSLQGMRGTQRRRHACASGALQPHPQPGHQVVDQIRETDGLAEQAGGAGAGLMAARECM